MATANRKPHHRSIHRRNRQLGQWHPLRWRIWLVLALLLALLWLAWNWSFLRGQAGLGTAYGARVACSCKFVGGREFGDCDKDMVKGMEMVSITLDEDARAVTASVPLLASATARYREGFGCVLDPVE